MMLFIACLTPAIASAMLPVVSTTNARVGNGTTEPASMKLKPNIFLASKSVIKRKKSVLFGLPTLCGLFPV